MKAFSDTSHNQRAQFVIALASHPLIQPEIEKTYAENPVHYYVAYQSSVLFEHPFFDLHPTRVYQYIKKMAGIYADALAREDQTEVERLVRKGYNSVYRYVNKRDYVTYGDAIQVALKGRSVQALSESEIGNLNVILLNILQTTQTDMVASRSSLDWTQQFLDHQAKMVRARDQHTPVKDYYEPVRRLMQHLKPKEATYQINNVFYNLIEADVASVYQAHQYTAETVPNTIYQDIRSKIFKQGGTSAVLGVISGMLTYIGISEMLLDQKVTKKEMERFLAHYASLFEGNQLDDALEKPLLYALLAAWSIQREYAYTRTVALDAEERLAFERQQVVESDAQKEVRVLKAHIQKMEAEQADTKSKYEAATARLETVEREWKRTTEALEKAQANDKERIALRNHLFQMQQEAEVPPVSDQTDAHKRLEETDTVIVGGHPNWVASMKDVFPAFTYISGQAVNADLSRLNRPGTHVFFNTDNNSHAQYERVTAVMNHNDNPFHYLSGTTNVARTIARMAAALNE